MQDGVAACLHRIVSADKKECCKEVCDWLKVSLQSTLFCEDAWRVVPVEASLLRSRRQQSRSREAIGY